MDQGIFFWIKKVQIQSAQLYSKTRNSLLIPEYFNMNFNFQESKGAKYWLY